LISALECAKKSASYACQVVLKHITLTEIFMILQTVSSCKGASLDKVF